MKRGTNLWNITAQRWRLTQQGRGCSCSTCQPSHQTRYCHAFACMRVFNRCFLSPTFTTGWCFLSVSLLRSPGPSLATADLGFSWLFLLNTNFSLSEPIVRATAKEFKTVAKFPGNSPQQLVSVQPTTMEGWRKGRKWKNSMSALHEGNSSSLEQASHNFTSEKINPVPSFGSKPAGGSLVAGELLSLGPQRWLTEPPLQPDNVGAVALGSVFWSGWGDVWGYITITRLG